MSAGLTLAPDTGAEPVADWALAINRITICPKVANPNHHQISIYKFNNWFIEEPTVATTKLTSAFPVRRQDFEFEQVPRYWVNGDAFMTHVFNGMSALFPDGERFFVASVPSG